MIDTGFSRQILGIGAESSVCTKASASACSAILSLNHRAPLTARCVHGGWKIAKSHPPLQHVAHIALVVRAFNFSVEEVARHCFVPLTNERIANNPAELAPDKNLHSLRTLFNSRNVNSNRASAFHATAVA